VKDRVMTPDDQRLELSHVESGLDAWIPPRSLVVGLHVSIPRNMPGFCKALGGNGLKLCTSTPSLFSFRNVS